MYRGREEECPWSLNCFRPNHDASFSSSLDMSSSSSSSTGGKSVLFVCLGNICVRPLASASSAPAHAPELVKRSPLAEAVFQHLVVQRGLEGSITRIDSAGTVGYHVGEEPDERWVGCWEEESGS